MLFISFLIPNHFTQSNNDNVLTYATLLSIMLLNGGVVYGND